MSRSRVVSAVSLGVLCVAFAACAPSPSASPAPAAAPAGNPASSPPAAPPAAASTTQLATPIARTTVRLAVPAKSLVFLPYYFGKEKGFFAAQGIDLDIAVVQPSTAVAAAVAGEVDYTAASGSSMGAALAGAPLRNL